MATKFLRRARYSQNDARVKRLIKVLRAMARDNLIEELKTGVLPAGTHEQYRKRYNKGLPSENQMTVSGLRRILTWLGSTQPDLIQVPAGGPIMIKAPDIVEKVVRGGNVDDESDQD